MGARVVVVTGASGGIGRAASREFARRGDRLALLARGQKGLDAAAEDVRRLGSTALTLAVDVADPTAVDAAAERVEAELGPIDVWVNVAFTSVFAPLRRHHTGRSTGGSPRSATSATCTRRWRRCARMKARDARHDRAGRAPPWPTAASRCRRRTAARSTPSRASTSRCAASCCTSSSGVHVTMVQMPAVNTPQFSWVLSRLPRHAQPVPPIYQPEVAARAFVYAADHPAAPRVLGRRQHRRPPCSRTRSRRGCSTATWRRTGFASQQTEEANRPTNRRTCGSRRTAPRADFGAHGVFDRCARPQPPAVGRHHYGALAAAWRPVSRWGARPSQSGAGDEREPTVGGRRQRRCFCSG